MPATRPHPPAPLVSALATGESTHSLKHSYADNLAELDRCLVGAGCITAERRPLVRRAPKLRELRAMTASDRQTSMAAVLDRIRRQHEREDLGSALRPLFRQRYGLQMQHGGKRTREVVER